MANRHLLAASRADEFKAWLAENGWVIEAPKDYYEVIRARRGKRVLIVYRRLEKGQHLTIHDKDAGVVRAFLKDKRRRRKEEDENAG